MYNEIYETQDDIFDETRDSIRKKIDENCTEEEKLYLMGKNDKFGLDNSKLEKLSNRFDNMFTKEEIDCILNDSIYEKIETYYDKKKIEQFKHENGNFELDANELEEIHNELNNKFNEVEKEYLLKKRDELLLQQKNYEGATVACSETIENTTENNITSNF